MDMQIVLPKELFGFRIAVLHQRHSDLRRFLHDIAQLTSDLKLAAALREHRLDEEDLAARLCPGQSGYNTGTGCLSQLLMQDRRTPQKFLQALLADAKALLLALDQLDSGMAAQYVHLALQAAHAGFRRVAGDDRMQRFICQLQLLTL